MGYRLVKFEVCPKENEQLEVTVKLPKEPRSVIHGVVLDCDNKPIKDAVVKLFKVNSSSCKPNTCKPSCSLTPITHTFTDDCGQFIFGPLCPNQKYIIKVWYDHVKITPIVIKPDPCNSHRFDECDDDFRASSDEQENVNEVDESYFEEEEQ